MPDQGDAPENEQERDRGELLAFVYELRDLLKAIVEDGRFIPEGRTEGVQRAWTRVQARFSELIRMLEQPLTNLPWSNLDAHGLTGDELALKRQGWLGSIFAWGRRINRSWVRSVLRWGDTLLGSLAAVFPPAGPIKEFKEALENLIEDSAANARRGRNRKTSSGS
jgi:hypothetical protein